MTKEEEMFFFLADICGYTNYMLSNAQEEQHGMLAISILLESIVNSIESPFEISKLEGDAIFIFVRKKVRDPFWLSKKVFQLFSIFEKRRQELMLSALCQCGGCKNIDKLTLKVVGHYGKAMIEKIGRFEELMGIDVIILHRLLKNHVPTQRYLLLTEPAYQHMKFSDDLKVSQIDEFYNDVGTIPLYVFDPPTIPFDEIPQKISYLKKTLRVGRFMYLDMLDKTGLKKLGNFRNLP